MTKMICFFAIFSVVLLICNAGVAEAKAVPDGHDEFVEDFPALEKVEEEIKKIDGHDGLDGHDDVDGQEIKRDGHDGREQLRDGHELVKRSATDGGGSHPHRLNLVQRSGLLEVEPLLDGHELVKRAAFAEDGHDDIEVSLDELEDLSAERVEMMEEEEEKDPEAARVEAQQEQQNEAAAMKTLAEADKAFEDFDKGANAAIKQSEAVENEIRKDLEEQNEHDIEGA